MADARFMSWHRAGPLAIAVIAWASLPGCGGGDTSGSGGTAGTTTTTSMTTGGTGGSTGGTGGMTTTGGGGTGGGMPEVTALATDRALDSTPSSTGDTVYYTASTIDGPGVLSVPGAGGTSTKLFVGDPFVAPLGITITGDDKTLLIADPGAETNVDDPKTTRGAIYSLQATGGTPAIVNGTEGYKARGVDIGDDAGEETIFFTGVDKADNVPGVFKLPVGGGTPKKVANGAPFADPSGIAVGKTTIFVADTGADDGMAQSRLGSVIAVTIANGTATTFVTGLGVGYPTGIALSSDEKTLYVSGVDPEAGTDLVYIVDVASKMVTTYNGGDVAKNRDAGGLHRARKTDVFSWADLSAGNGGAVYKVTFK